MDRDTFARIVAGDWTEDLTRAEAEAFEKLLDDPECQELLARAEGELDELAEQWEPPEPNWDRVTTALRAELNEPRKVITAHFGPPPAESWSSPRVFAIAAGLLFLVGISFVLNSLGPRNPASQAGGTAYMSINVPAPPHSQAIALQKPAAELVSKQAGEGYTVSESVVDDDLLVVVIEQDS